MRGLLCKNCNIGLGNFKDQVTSLARAIVYLTVSNASDIAAKPDIVKEAEKEKELDTEQDDNSTEF